MNENQLLYISSTLSQVIATLFGLSVTGYIFLDEKLKTDITSDDSLIDILGQLKVKYRNQIIFTGILTFLGITFCIINVSLGIESILLHKFVNNFILNNSIFISLIVVARIIFFVIEIIDPNKIEKESSIGKKQLIEELEEAPSDINKTENNITIGDFLNIYNQIERKISDIAKPFHDKKINSTNNMYHNLKLVMYSEKIDEKLLEQINSLRKYRNYLVHGRDMNVDKKFYNLASNINQILDNIN